MGFFRVCAVLLYYGASTTLANAHRHVAREEAKAGGEAAAVFDIYARKVRG
jgi:hypothetical protein